MKVDVDRVEFEEPVSEDILLACWESGLYFVNVAGFAMHMALCNLLCKETVTCDNNQLPTPSLSIMIESEISRYGRCWISYLLAIM